MKLSGLSFFLEHAQKLLKLNLVLVLVLVLKSKALYHWIRCCVELYHGTIPRTLSLLLYGYYQLAEESAANFVPQNTSTESSTVQFDTIPTQSFSSSQNADINPTLKRVLLRTWLLPLRCLLCRFQFFFTALKMVLFVFQPLMECYVNLRERGTAINIHLTETWWRHYQVGTTSLKEGQGNCKICSS